MSPTIFDAPDWPYSKAKTAVVLAALSVIREGGPRAATLKNIATRAGITEPAIFRHFTGIDGLFEGLHFVYIRIAERGKVGFKEGRGAVRLRAGMRSVCEACCMDRGLTYLLAHGEHIFRGYPDLKASVFEQRNRLKRIIRETLGELIEDGGAGFAPSDVDTVGLSLLGLIFMCAIKWNESDEEDEIFPTMTSLIDNCMRLYGIPEINN